MTLRPHRFRTWMLPVLCWALLFGACAGPAPVPRIGYAHPAWIEGQAIVALAQQEIDGWGSPRVAEIHAVHTDTVQAGYAAEVRMAEALVSVPNMVGVVGHLNSRASLLAAPIYTEAGIPLVVPTGTSRRLRDVGPLVFPLAPDEDAEGEFIAAFVLGRFGAARVTIFYLNADEYGVGLRDGVVRALRKRGLEPVDQVGVLFDSDFPTIVAASLARGTPQAVVVAGRNGQADRIAHAVHERLPGTPVVSGDGVVVSATYGQALGAAARSFYAVAFWHPDLANEVSRAFVDRCRQVPRLDPTGSGAMLHDGLLVLAQAIRDVGPSPASVRRYLAELGVSRPPYRGVTGPISFIRDRPTNLVMTHAVDAAVVVVNGR